MKILIIEDNPDILEIVNLILTDAGHEVISCTDGSSITELKNIQPEIILIDEILPEKRGSQICLELKSVDCYKHIPVVLISTVPQLDELAQKCSADAYIEKPFDIEKLIALINDLPAQTT